MIRGIQIALAMLVFSFLPGVTVIANATSPSIQASTNNTPCLLPSYALVTSLKYGNHIQTSNGHVPFVPAIFTAPKPVNGAMTGVVGAEAVTGEASTSPVSSVTPPIPVAQADAVPQQSAYNTSGLSSEKLFAMVNSHRENRGLPPLQNDSTLAGVAQARAPELQGELATGALHAGFYSKDLPYRATENMISQNTEEEALNWWLNSGVHRGAIEGNYTHASVACQGKNCAMIFANIAPKQQ